PAALASSRAYHADADAVRGSATPGPARDAKPSGTRRCKNAGTNVHAGHGNARSNPAVRTAASKNLRALMLGAGPRPPMPRLLAWPLPLVRQSPGSCPRRASAQPLPIPPRLTAPSLASRIAGSITPAGLPTPPAPSRLLTTFAAIACLRTPRPEQPFAALEQT